MDELQKIARAYYDAGSETNKSLLRNFFNAMDSNKDGSIDYVEFKDFMISRGYRYYVNRSMFLELAGRRRGRLRFNDVRTLSYIILSRRPFCEKCDQLVTGVYFACVGCFHLSRRSYCICLACYGHTEYDFRHGSCRDRPQFWDNFAILESWRLNALTQKRVGQPRGQSSSRLTQAQSSPSTSSAQVAEHSRRPSNLNPSQSRQVTPRSSSTASSSQSSSSTDIVRSKSRIRMDNAKGKAWNDLERALGIASTLVTIGVGAAACTIM